MLWVGHRAFAKAVIQVGKAFGLEVGEGDVKTAVKYSVYPDEIFMKGHKCPWHTCKVALPCVPSPDFHHVRWCGRYAVEELWKALERKFDWKTFGILTHFVADLICEPYEGVPLEKPKEQWDYREKAGPLSRMMAEKEGQIVRDAVRLLYEVNEAKGLVFSAKHEWYGLAVSKYDLIQIVGYAARAKVQRRKFYEALVEATALTAFILLDTARRR